MKLDLSRLQAAHSAHTAATQALLDTNAAAKSAASDANASIVAAQAEVDTLVNEIDTQTSAINAFNLANPAPAA